MLSLLLLVVGATLNRRIQNQTYYNLSNSNKTTAASTYQSTGDEDEDDYDGDGDDLSNNNKRNSNKTCCWVFSRGNTNDVVMK